MADQDIAVLQRFVSSFVADARTVLAAAADPAVPTPARRVLVGALNYVLDLFDAFPDHYAGLGVADDAVFLRLAAAQAVVAGAEREDLRLLGAQAEEVRPLFGPLTDRLDALVAKLPERAVLARTADKILTSKDAFVFFEADLGRALAKHTPQTIDTSLASSATLSDLRRMAESFLKRAGV